jgi:ATP-dependent DNA ligase
VLLAFDLIELDGEVDLRRAPIEQRKRQLAKLVRRPQAASFSVLPPLSGRSPCKEERSRSIAATAIASDGC